MGTEELNHLNEQLDVSLDPASLLENLKEEVLLDPEKYKDISDIIISHILEKHSDIIEKDIVGIVQLFLIYHYQEGVSVEKLLEKFDYFMDVYGDRRFVTYETFYLLLINSEYVFNSDREGITLMFEILDQISSKAQRTATGEGILWDPTWGVVEAMSMSRYLVGLVLSGKYTVDEVVESLTRFSDNFDKLVVVGLNKRIFKLHQFRLFSQMGENVDIDKLFQIQGELINISKSNGGGIGIIGKMVVRTGGISNLWRLVGIFSCDIYQGKYTVEQLEKTILEITDGISTLDINFYGGENDIALQFAGIILEKGLSTDQFVSDFEEAYNKFNELYENSKLPIILTSSYLYTKYNVLGKLQSSVDNIGIANNEDFIGFGRAEMFTEIGTYILGDKPLEKPYY